MTVLIGCGKWGKNYLQFDLSAVYDPANIYVGIGNHSSLDTLLAKCDRVIIATPAETHADVAVRALDAGCDVLIEKPMATTVEDCARILEHQRDRIVMVGHLMLFHDDWPRFKKSYHKGDDIYAVRRGGRERKESPMLSLGSHDMALIIDLLGQPHSVVSDGRHLEGRAGGTCFAIDADFGTDVERYLTDGEATFTGTGGNPLKAQYDEFMRCCDTRDKPYSDGVFGMNVVRGILCSDTERGSGKARRTTKTAR